MIIIKIIFLLISFLFISIAMVWISHILLTDMWEEFKNWKKRKEK